MKTNNSTLSKKLKQYSALAGSVIAATGLANAQVVYTDIPDVVFIGTNPFPGNQLGLDLNNDGITDFLFWNWKSSNQQFVGVVPPYSTNSNAIIGTLGTTSGNPFLIDGALAFNDNIDSNQPFYKLSDLIFSTSQFYVPIMAFSSTGNPNGAGPWIGLQDHYLGLKFTPDNGATYDFGWVRCSVSADADTLTIKDYAYNSTPNHGLPAGGTFGTGIISQSSTGSFSIFGYEGVANIFVNDGKLDGATVSVTNMLGETVIKQSLTDRSTRIDLNQFAKGIYLVTVQRGDEIFSKKISFR